MGITRKYPIYFIMPALLVFILFFIVPTVIGIYYSFTNWSVYDDAVKFIGLDNYKKMLTNKTVITAFKNTLMFGAIVTIAQNVFGLLLALLVNKIIILRNFFRTMFFMPFVIAPVIIGYVFSTIYEPKNGVLNSFLDFVGLDVLIQPWLTDPNIALFSIIMTDIWRVTGFAMIIYIAGLQYIPKELIESAKIDGANAWQTFRNVTFPLLASSFTINVTLSLITALKVFEVVLVLTNGGPGYHTEVLYTLIMKQFGLGELGYSTAINMVLVLLISAIGLPILYFLRKREVEI